MPETETVQTSTSTIEDAGACRKKVTVEIPASRVREQIADAFSHVAEQATLPGFRQGRAPKKLIERRFGKHARDEAKQRLASEAIRAAIQEHSLKILGDPEGGDELADADLSGESPIRFSFEVEVVPEFSLPDLSGLEVYKPMIEVTEAMAADEIQKLCVNEGDLQAVEGASEPGDYLVGRGVMTLDSDSSVVHDIEGAVLRAPAAGENTGMALGVSFDGFADATVGRRAGDEIVLKTTAPDEHEVEAIRNQPVTVTFTVTDVHRIKPLEPMALVERFGLESEDQFRDAVMLRLNQRALIEQQAVLRQQLARELIEMVEFDLPEKITARQTERNIERRRLELLYRGVDQEEIDRSMDELRSSVAGASRNELKLFFILGKAAMDRQTPVNEQEVMGRIAQIAAEAGQRPEQVRQEFIRTGRINALANQIREHKVLDAMLGEVKIIEKPLDEFNDLMRARAAAKRSGGTSAEGESAESSKKKTSKKTSKKAGTKKEG